MTAAHFGRYSDAACHLRHCLDLHNAVGDVVGQGFTYHNLAFVEGRQGHADKALDYARHALARFRDSGHRAGEAKVLNAIGWYSALLGDTNAAAGDRGAAYDAWRRALEILHELGHPDTDRVEAKLR